MNRLVILAQEKRDFMNHSDFISEQPCHQTPSERHITKKVIYKCQPTVSAMTDGGIEGQRDERIGSGRRRERFRDRGVRGMERPQSCCSGIGQAHSGGRWRANLNCLTNARFPIGSSDGLKDGWMDEAKYLVCFLSCCFSMQQQQVKNHTS